MKFWHATAFINPDQLLELSRTIQDAGFDGMVVPDHMVYPQELRSVYPYSADGRPIWGPEMAWPDPWVLIGALSSYCPRLRFATNIYVAPARNPFVIAKAVGTAAVLSGNRVALGAGVGWMREEFALLGQSFTNRGRRLDELLEVLRLLWTGGMVEYHGRYYDFGPLEMAPAPTERVPIWGGGDSPMAMRRAALLCDGWIGNGYLEDRAVAMVGALREELDAVGRLDEPFEIMLVPRERPNPELLHRLEDIGVTSVICAPWMLTNVNRADVRSGGPADLKAKQEAVRQFASTVIGPMG